MVRDWNLGTLTKKQKVALLRAIKILVENDLIDLGCILRNCLKNGSEEKNQGAQDQGHRQDDRVSEAT